METAKGGRIELELRATMAQLRAPIGALPPGASGILLAYPRPRALGVSLGTASSTTDVVLMDEGKRVVKVASALTPGLARRVDVIPSLYQFALVLPSGRAAKAGIAEGDSLTFELPEEARPSRVLLPVTLMPPGRAAVTVLCELALDPQETSMGLMYRRVLPPEGGMLFRFPKAEELWFYMKNTLIPLDMIFINESHTVTGVVHRARPLDESTVGVGPIPNRYVLEVRAGFARRHGIVAGTQVSFQLPE
jgi:uncharacterized membrane protein (UPF0127 family)